MQPIKKTKSHLFLKNTGCFLHYFLIRTSLAPYSRMSGSVWVLDFWKPSCSWKRVQNGGALLPHSRLWSWKVTWRVGKPELASDHDGEADEVQLNVENAGYSFNWPSRLSQVASGPINENSVVRWHTVTNCSWICQGGKGRARPAFCITVNCSWSIYLLLY